MSVMPGKQYKAALERYGITQGQASWLFNGKSRTSGRRWAAEGAPYTVALMIAVMDYYGITPDDIEELGAPWRKKTPKPKAKSKRK